MYKIGKNVLYTFHLNVIGGTKLDVKKINRKKFENMNRKTFETKKSPSQESTTPKYISNYTLISLSIILFNFLP